MIYVFRYLHSFRSLQAEDPPTLVALRGFGDVDGQLPGEGVHAHHAAVGGARELGVSSGDAVERLRDVRRALQDDLLRQEHVMHE